MSWAGSFGRLRLLMRTKFLVQTVMETVRSQMVLAWKSRYSRMGRVCHLRRRWTTQRPMVRMGKKSKARNMLTMELRRPRQKKNLTQVMVDIEPEQSKDLYQ